MLASLALVLVLCLGLALPAAAADQQPVTINKEAYERILSALQSQNGDSDLSRWTDTDIIMAAIALTSGEYGGLPGNETITTDPWNASASPFVDVPELSPYYQGILWAAANQITTGVTPTTFCPSAPCTRAQIVTFLWRAAGRPEPKVSYGQYMDVNDPSVYYHKAVHWGAGLNMESSGTFRPNDPCTRFDAVYFIWCAYGCPAPTKEAHFADLQEKEDLDFIHPIQCVHWAVEKGITKGTGDGTTFSPNDPCTRGQIAAFLYRASHT